MAVWKSQGRKLDLSKHDISYEEVSFKSGGRKKGERTMAIREGIFDDLIELVRPVSMKLVLVLTIYKYVTLGHKPYVQATFKDLSEEIGCDPCVLRRYSKALSKENLIKFSKVEGAPSEYVFSMGKKFKNYLWSSKLYRKIQSDHVDNFQKQEDSSVRDGLGSDKKQTMEDCDTDHGGLPQNLQDDGKISESEKKSLLSSSSSSLYMSYAKSDMSMSGGDKKSEIDIGSLDERWQRYARLGGAK